MKVDYDLKALNDRAETDSFVSDHERDMYRLWMRGLLTRDELSQELGWPVPVRTPLAGKR